MLKSGLKSPKVKEHFNGWIMVLWIDIKDFVKKVLDIGLVFRVFGNGPGDGVGWLVGFYGTSTFVGNLTSNLFLCK